MAVSNKLDKGADNKIDDVQINSTTFEKPFVAVQHKVCKTSHVSQEITSDNMNYVSSDDQEGTRDKVELFHVP